MSSEVGREHAARRPPELGTLSAETHATLQHEERQGTADDCSLSTGADTDAGKTCTSGLASLGVAENGPCGDVDGQEDRTMEMSKSRCEDLASDEKSDEKSLTRRQQQLFSTTRSQYHSIQQLSRPSNTLAPQTTASGRALFGTERTYQLDNSGELYCQATGNSSDVAAGRYFTETTGQSRSDANDVTVSPARKCERRRDPSDSEDGDEGSACTEFGVDDDERPADSERCGADGHGQETTSTVTTKAWSSDCQNGSGNTATDGELEAKRARVEHIVRSMQTPPSDGGQQLSAITACHETTHQQQHSIDGRRQRRKQFAPLQHQHDGRRPPHLRRSYVVDDLDSDREADDSWGSQLDSSERDALRAGLQRVHDRLADIHSKYANYLDESSEDDVVVDVDNDVRTDKCPRDDADDALIGADFNRNEIWRAATDNGDAAGADGGSGSGSLESLARMIKAEISDSVGNMVDEIVRSFVARRLKLADGGGDDPAGGPLTPTQPSTLSTASSPDIHLAVPSRTDTVSSGALPPPLAPVGASCTAVDLRFPVLQPSPAAAASIPVMERTAAAAKLVAERYSLQSAAAMAAYLDNAFLLHGKTAFEMPPSHSATSSTSPASATHRLFTPTPYYPAQRSALQPHLIKVNMLLVSRNVQFRRLDICYSVQA